MDDIKYGEKYYIQCHECKKMIEYNKICECGYSIIKENIEKIKEIIR